MIDVRFGIVGRLPQGFNGFVSLIVFVVLQVELVFSEFLDVLLQLQILRSQRGDFRRVHPAPDQCVVVALAVESGDISVRILL